MKIFCSRNATPCQIWSKACPVAVGGTAGVGVVALPVVTLGAVPLELELGAIRVSSRTAAREEGYKGGIQLTRMYVSTSLIHTRLSYSAVSTITIVAEPKATIFQFHCHNSLLTNNLSIMDLQTQSVNCLMNTKHYDKYH